MSQAFATQEQRTGDQRVRRRFARRQWLRRWRVWRWVLAVTLLVGLLGLGIWLVWFSSALTVTRVEVIGEQQLSEQRVLRAAKVPLGEPLIGVAVGRIDRRVGALAPVREVAVEKVWPHTIRITVTERVAVAVVTVGDSVRAMDAEGVLFRTYARAPRGLPRIRTEGAVDTPSLREAGLVLAALPPEVSRLVAYCSVESIDEITLRLRDGREVLWGSADSSSDKGRVLAALLKRRATYYDVSVPGLPTYR